MGARLTKYILPITEHSMINGQLKSKIDKLWEEFWTGGITNPLTVIEQITFLMYARLLDMNETSDEKKALRTNQSFKHRFNQDQIGRAHV